MDKKKKIMFLISIVMLISIVIVSGATLTTIAPGASTEVNYTFTGYGSNISTYFTLPRTANVTSALMNITGFRGFNGTISTNKLLEGSSISYDGFNAITSNDGNIHIVVSLQTGGALRHYKYNGTWSSITYLEDLRRVAITPILNDDIGILNIDPLSRVYYKNGTFQVSMTNTSFISAPNVNAFTSTDYNNNTGNFNAYYHNWASTSKNLIHIEFNVTDNIWHSEVVDQNIYATDVIGRLGKDGYEKVAYTKNITGLTGFNILLANGSFSNWNIITVDTNCRNWGISEDIDSEGNINIYYTKNNGATNYLLKHAESSDNGASWTIETVDSSTSTSNIIFPDSSIRTSFGLNVIAYTKDPDGAGERLYYAIEENGVWTSTEVIDYSTTDTYGASLVEYNGNVYLFYNDFSDTSVRYIIIHSEYPSAVSLDISNDGDNEFSQATTFSTENTTSNFWKELQDYIDSHATTTNVNTLLNLTSYSDGIIGGSDVIITYTHKPFINSNETYPIIPHFWNTTYVSANVTDDDGDIIESVNFTIRAPDLSVFINNLNGTQDGDIWNSSTFTINQSGTYLVQINATANDTLMWNQQWTFDSTLGELEYSPKTKSYAQVAGSSEFTNVSLSHNGSTYNEVDFSLAGDLANTTAFTTTFTTEPLNVSPSNTHYVNVTIKSNASLATGIYTGAVVLNRTSDQNMSYINFTINIAASLGIIKLTPVSKSDSMTAGGSISWNLQVSNIGNRDLEHCNLTDIGGISAFTIFNKNDFTVTNTTPVDVNVQYNAPLVGTYSGSIEVLCTAIAGGGTDQEFVNPIDLTVVSAGGSVGGGGGITIVQGTEDCDIGYPSKITLDSSPSGSIVKVIIENKEEKSHTYNYEIISPKSGLDGKSFLEYRILTPIIEGGTKGEISILLDREKFGNITDTYYAQLAISSSECKAEFIPIEISPSGLGIPEFLKVAMDKMEEWFPFLKEKFTIGNSETTYWTPIGLLFAVLLFTSVGVLSAKFKKKPGMAISVGVITATLLMTVVLFILNYFVLSSVV